MANPFYVQPAGDFTQGLSGISSVLGQIGEENKAREAQEAEAAATKEAQAAVIQGMRSGDPDQMRELGVLYPEYREQVKDSVAAQTGIDEKERIDFMTRALANPEGVPALYQERIQGLIDRGDDASHSLKSYEEFMNDPAAKLKEMDMTLAWLEPKAHKALQESQKVAQEAKLGAVSPKDFTVESMAQYAETGAIGDLVRYTPEVKEIAGVPHQYNQESLKWEPLVDMRSQGLSEQTQAAAGLEAQKQSKLDFEKQRTKFHAAESQTIGKIDSAKSKHEILVNTIAEINRTRSGWSTQYGAALSGLPASEARKMAGLINTVKANSAFGTLSDIKATGGTLGAISAPELVLLEAALGTLDQYGDNEEQMRITDQITKANQSSITRLENAFAMDRKKYGTSFEEAEREADIDASMQTITTQVQFDALPSGAEYIENGQRYRKP